MIGDRLRIIRKKAEISTKEADRLADVKPGCTWALENSKSGNAETKTLDKLATMFGVSLDYLVRGEGQEPSTDEVQSAVAAARARLASKNEKPAKPAA